MRRTVRWTRRATRRLDQAAACIAEDSPAAASRIVTRIVAAVDALADQPGIGRPGRIKDTRELVLAGLPDIIAYRVTPDTIEILTVMHGAQQWPDIL